MEIPAPKRPIVYREYRSEWQGLLPHPEDLEKYERFIPDAGNRLLTLVENERSHDIKARQKALELDGKALNLTKVAIRNDLIAKFLSVGAALAMFVLAYRLYMADKPVPASVFTAITAVAGYYGLRRRRRGE